MYDEYDDDLPPNLRAAQAAKNLLDKVEPMKFDPELQAVVEDCLDAGREAREAARDAAAGRDAMRTLENFPAPGAPVNRTFGTEGSYFAESRARGWPNRGDTEYEGLELGRYLKAAVYGTGSLQGAPDADLYVRGLERRHGHGRRASGADSARGQGDRRATERADDTEWHHLAVSALEHPNVVSGEELIPGAITQAAVESIGRNYGPDSAYYKTTVLGEFAHVDAQVLVPSRKWLDDAAERWQMVHDYKAGGVPLPPELDPDDSMPIFGVDVARMGGDASVLAVRRGPILQELVMWRMLEIPQTVNRVIRELMERGHAANSQYGLAVDAVGMGVGVVDGLRAKGWRATPVYAGSGAPSGEDAKRFTNLKAYAYWELRRLLEYGRF